MGWCDCMADEYVEDPDPDKEDCKVEDEDPKDVCKDKPTGVEEGTGVEEVQPPPDTTSAFPPVEPEEPEPETDLTETDPVEMPVVLTSCKPGWNYDLDLERCVDTACDPDNPNYDIEKCCVEGEDGYVDQLCRDICDPGFEGYDEDECCDLESPWYDADACEVEIEPVIEPEDPEDPEEIDPEDSIENPDVVVVDELPPGVMSKCSNYINDGALEGLPVVASPEETKMFDLMNAYRVSKGWGAWKWNQELHLACVSIGRFKLGAEGTPAYEKDYDVARFSSLKSVVEYYGYHQPVAPMYQYYKGPQPDAGFIWDQTLNTKWGLKMALGDLPGFVDCAVALVAPRSWVWMVARGNECDEPDEEEPDVIDPDESIEGADELFDPAITGTECDVEAGIYDAGWVWDETDKKCKGPTDPGPIDTEDPDVIDPDESIEGADEIFVPDQEPKEPESEPVDEPEPETEPVDEPEPETEPVDEPVDEPEPESEPVDEPVDEPEPEPVEPAFPVDPEPEPDLEPDHFENGATLPVGFVKPFDGTECDPNSEKYNEEFEWNRGTQECKKRKEPEPEETVTEPETPAVELTGTPCMISTANNFFKPGPCTFDVDPNICADVLANNHGMPKPCTYDPVTCDDVAADNHGGALPCTYTVKTPEPVIGEPAVEPEIPYSEIPCYDDELGWIRCDKDDPDVLKDTDGDLDDDGILDDVDPDDDNDLIPDVEDYNPFMPDTPAEPVVDPDPPAPVQPGEGVADFLGAKVVGKRFAFILDHSASMVGGLTETPPVAVPLQRWTILVNAVEKTMNNLPDDTAIWIGCFSGPLDSAYAIEAAKEGWKRDIVFPGGWTTAGNRVAIVQWLRSVVCNGATDPLNIISKCFKSSGGDPGLDPEVVFMLSDGSFTDGDAVVVKHFAKHNVTLRKKVGLLPILTHTFTVVDPGGKSGLNQIIGVTNIGMGFGRWTGPCTYRHLTYGALQDLPV